MHKSCPNHSCCFFCEQNAKNLPNDPNKPKRKFSSFFKSLVIELDKDLYGPDNHLVEVSVWYSVRKSSLYQPILIMYIYESFTNKYTPRNR